METLLIILVLLLIALWATAAVAENNITKTQVEFRKRLRDMIDRCEDRDMYQRRSLIQIERAAHNKTYYMAEDEKQIILATATLHKESLTDKRDIKALEFGIKEFKKNMLVD